MTRHIFFGIAMMALSSCFLGCVTRSPKASPDQTQLRNEILELQKTQGQQAATIEELNNKILLLKDQLEHTETTSANLNTMPPAPVPRQVAAIEENKVLQKGSSGAEKLWAQALKNARKPVLQDLQKDVELLLKAYKYSPITNNALYLLAHSYYERKQYNEAALKFEQLYKTFPDGNKAVASLFKLGLCYQKLGKPTEAREAFHNVVALYPGSREATESESYLSANGEAVQ